MSEVQEPHPQPPPRRRGGSYNVLHLIRKRYNIKLLKGELSGYYRYRVGNYRVIYQIDDDLNQVTILLIGHRSRVYE
ncbi:type II toxin-antitoxin system RelE family toxin [Nostoc sp.]|uniref:type II toxin-antitoxin system RelE family toxin n=1 Tax=Nostoc sp. TaxID=1180 RepID=UPI002FFB7BBB